MFYFAFFLEETGFIEKCLILLKHIGNANSKSVPHITLRLFKSNNTKLNYLRERTITYLNIVEPGTFNFEEKNGKYVVFLKCESEELEELDYRPDYPFSRLHITLYEGYDLNYAKFLFKELKKINWGIKLLFNHPKKLEEKKLGSRVETEIDYPRIARDIFKDDRYLKSGIDDGNLKKRNALASAVLKELKKYIEHPNQVERIESVFQDNGNINITSMAGNESENKPVQDAIFVTPPEYAQDMAFCAINAFQGTYQIKFGDSSVGTGTLYLALKRYLAEYNNEQVNENQKLSITSAIGIDIDKEMATEAYKRFNKRDLEVIWGDATNPELPLNDLRNLMIVNPPYNRNRDIPSDYRKKLQIIAKLQTGIDVSARAGLFVYHMLIMDKWLDKNGVGVWLIPSIFLSANYGVALRKYLTSNVQLIRIHIYDEKLEQFNKAMVSTAIVVFKKTAVAPNASVTVSYGKSVENSEVSLKILTSSLTSSLENWGNLIPLTHHQNGKNITNGISFSDLFDIKRGIATGANNYFVIEREKAKQIGIPKIALKPVLPKSRYLSSKIIESSNDGYPLVKPQLVLIDCALDEENIRLEYPSFYDYLQKAKEIDNNGKRIIDGYLVKSRKPWYKQEERQAPMFLLTYMGRPKVGLPPLYFFYNKSNATALNTYILLYPKKWLEKVLKNNDSLCEKLLGCLNNPESTNLIQNMRVYSGGLRKLEPSELEKAQVYDLPSTIIDAYNTYIGCAE